MRNINRIARVAFYIIIGSQFRLFPHPLHDNASKRTSIASIGYRTEWKLLPISRRYSASDLRSRNTKRLLGGFIHENPR